MASSFRFKQFEVRNSKSALKVGTDAVLLGAAMSVREDDTNMLDIGTGTGVIALMAAQRSGAHIDAIDVDIPSCEEAQSNFEASPWQSRISLYNTPLQEFSPDSRYDLVFSNPPYYDESLKNPDSREATARHSVMLSKTDICSFAAKWLSPDGRLSLILPAEDEKEICRTAASFALYLFRIMRIKTSSRKTVRRIIVEFCRSRQTPVEEELVLQEGMERTEAYLRLTEEFYL